MKSKALFFTILVIILSGCNSGNKEFNLASPPANLPPGGGDGGGVQQQDLRSKTFAEVMTIKYNRAELVCSLWTMLSGELDLQRAPNDVFRKNLKAPVSFPIRFGLRGGVRGLGGDRFREVHRLDTDFSIHKIIIRESFGFEVVATQTRYDFMFSPEMGYSANASIRSWISGDEVEQTFPLPQGRINEKLDTEIINFQSDIIPNDFGYKIHDYVKCVIETDIRPEYRNHFKINGIAL